MINATAFLSFYKGACKLKDEASAVAYLSQWEDAMRDEEWWLSDGSPGVRVSKMLSSILPLYLQVRASQAPAAGKGRKATGERRSKRPVVATVGEFSSRFDRANDAEEWAMRRLLDEGAYAVALIVDERFPEGSKLRETRIDRDRAVRKLWGVRAPTSANHKGSTGGSGPWMKASQTRSSFSRG